MTPSLKYIPLVRPSFSDAELQGVKDTFESGWVAKGPVAHKFEAEIETYLGVNHAIAVTNCTAALHLAMLALGIGKDDRVIVSDYTFPSTGFAPRYCGAETILCDIDPRTYNMNPDRLEQILKWHPQKIKAIIVVHAFGQVAEMDKIMEIAKRYQIPIVEDAACALGAIYKGKQAGTMGDIGCFSLHARKGITTGEGGVVVTNIDAYANRMRKLSEFGVQSTWGREQGLFSIPTFEELGYNYKMSDITAAVGIAQLKKLDKLVQMRRATAAQYNDAINAGRMPFFTPVFESIDGGHIYQSFAPLVKEEYQKDRANIIQLFRDHGVQATIGTYALHRQPYFSQPKSLIVSSMVYDRAIALPIWPGVDVKYVIKTGEKIWTKELRSLQKRRERSIFRKPIGGNSGIEDLQEPLR